MCNLAYDAGSNAKLAAIRPSNDNNAKLAVERRRVPSPTDFEIFVLLHAFGLNRPPNEACDRSLRTRTVGRRANELDIDRP